MQAVDVLRQHFLNRRIVLKPCPVCSKEMWQVPPDLASAFSTRRGSAEARFETIPTVLLVCGNCYFYYPFLWEPIRGEIDGEE